jgi:hypothetical protein
MSTTSHIYKRLSRLYHGVLEHMRTLEWLTEHGMRPANRSTLPVMEPCEPRLLLSAPATWIATGSGIGGACYSPEVNPLNTGEMYINADMGEIWHGTGYSWVAVPYGSAPSGSSAPATWTTLDPVTQLASGVVAGDVEFTNNPNIQYAIDYPPGANDVLCQSTNDGTTWTVLPAAVNGTSLANIISLSVDPNSATNMVVETDHSGTWDIYYSTNSGQTFTSVDTGSDGGNIGGWIAGAFWDNGGANPTTTPTTTLWLGTNNGVYEATGVNTGSWSWTLPSALLNLKAASGTEFFSFTGSSNGGSTTLAAVTWTPWGGGTPQDSGNDIYNEYVGIFTDTSPSTDASWTSVVGTASEPVGYSQLGLTSGAQQIYPALVQMVPGDINDIYVAGGNRAPNAVPEAVYWSSNGGSTWKRMFEGGDTNIPEPAPSVTATATYTGTLTGGALQLGTAGVSVTNGGSGYINGDVTIEFSGGGNQTGGSSTAYATATLSGGVVTSINIVNGGMGYTSAPTITIVAQETANADVYTHFIGQNFTAEAGDFYGAAGAFQGFDAVKGPSGTILVVTNQGDAFRSDDGGVTWVSLGASNPPTPEGQPTPEGYNQATMASNMASVESGINETFTKNVIFPTPTTAFIGAADMFGMAGQLQGGTTWAWQNTLIQYTGDQKVDQVNQETYDPRTGILYASDSVAMLYVGMNAVFNYDLGTQGGGMMLASYDMGATWTPIHNFRSPVGTILLDPNNPNDMYIGIANSSTSVGGFWMTTDLQDGANAVWTQMGLPTRGEGMTQTLSNTDFPNMAWGAFCGYAPTQLYMLNNGAPGTPGTLVAAIFPNYTSQAQRGTETGGVWTATWNSAQGAYNSWTDVTAADSVAGSSGMPMADNLTSLTIDPNDPTQQTWYVTVADSGSVITNGFIYKTTNGGTTWTAWSDVCGTGNGKSGFAAGYALYVQPGTDAIYLGTPDNGVFYCPNGNVPAGTAVFTRLNNLPALGVSGIYGNPWNSNQIWVTTTGQGTFYGDTTSTTATPVQPINVTATAVNATEVQLAWTPITVPTSFVIQESTNGGTNWSLAATDPNGSDKAFLVTGLSGNTQYEFEVAAADPTTGSFSIPSNTVRTAGSSPTKGSTTARASLTATAATAAPAGRAAAHGWTPTPRTMTRSSPPIWPQTAVPRRGKTF